MNNVEKRASDNRAGQIGQMDGPVGKSPFLVRN
jgi:hypothetical protein